MATVHFHPGPAFAVAEISSLAFLESIEEVARELEQQTRRAGSRRLLINLLDVVGTFGPEEQRRIGLLAWKHLAHLEKVASLVPPEKITRVSEGAARAQGLELRVFTSLPDAIDWLMA